MNTRTPFNDKPMTPVPFEAPPTDLRAWPMPKPLQTAPWEKPAHTNGKAKFTKNAAGKARKSSFNQ